MTDTHGLRLSYAGHEYERLDQETARMRYVLGEQMYFEDDYGGMQRLVSGLRVDRVIFGFCWIRIS
jgi:hypothetical protein